MRHNRCHNCLEIEKELRAQLEREKEERERLVEEGYSYSADGSRLDRTHRVSIHIKGHPRFYGDWCPTLHEAIERAILALVKAEGGEGA